MFKKILINLVIFQPILMIAMNNKPHAFSSIPHIQGRTRKQKKELQDQNIHLKSNVNYGDYCIEHFIDETTLILGRTNEKNQLILTINGGPEVFASFYPSSCQRVGDIVYLYNKANGINKSITYSLK